MHAKRVWFAAFGLGCAVLAILLIAVIAISLFVMPWQIRTAVTALESQLAVGQTPTVVWGNVALPTPEPAVQELSVDQPEPMLTQVPVDQADLLPTLYRQTNPGIVNIKIYTRRGTQGAGSGFIIDDQGHIVTNNHVVAGAARVVVAFYNGLEAEATIVGTDPDSDLAVIKVAHLVEGAYPLPLGDSDQVVVGEPVIAIGNPFGLGSSMTVGIVSAVGRTIPSGATPFSIPHAIQTDAAINPGNSGGPLINMRGQVIGVNAQIATGGTAANAGVGFAIPANIVRRVAPVLIAEGSYQWPWLGISGGSVNLAVMKANELAEQRGAYVDQVTPGSPAAQAGLRGSSGTRVVDGLETPVGGDVILAIDGRPIAHYDALLVEIAAHNPGDQVELTILRGGQRMQLTVTLAARPSR